MRAEYDHRADALYVYLTDAEVASTVELASDLIVDEDADGRPRGVEVLSPRDADLARLFEHYPMDARAFRDTVERALGVTPERLKGLGLDE